MLFGFRGAAVSDGLVIGDEYEGTLVVSDESKLIVGVGLLVDVGRGSVYPGNTIWLLQ